MAGKCIGAKGVQKIAHETFPSTEEGKIIR